ncbi:hypothetical protein [Pelagerythrobacter rhizovicinus]|uniref:Uncharacterized protein n=1 Tax=Pelagerythrobacter rhizovicinus TaxID=2268576 RepID=A0A4Q2KLB6_9SPHN|nr:hypothetical protein [Pelagerythrobacter rhizovicinus]RXZ64252.1 hypothetical protein ETX26_10085 [Pelagerythrobacter rhizovicinus]
MNTKKTKSTKLGAKASRSDKKSRTSSTKPIAERLLQFVEAADDPPLMDRYDALMGVGRPVDDVLASYRDLFKEGAKVGLASIERSMVKEGADLKFQVSRIAIRPFADPDFSIADARKVPAKYGSAGYDGIASVRFCPVPHPDTGADMIAMDTVVLYSGNPPPSRPVRRRRSPAATDGVDHAASVTFNLNDGAAVKAALASIFYPPLAHLPIGDPFEDKDKRFAKGSKQAERALVTLMCRSQLPVKKMLIGFGAGKSIVDGVHGRLEYLLKERCKGTPALVHRDLVPHFWFGELRRLELHHLSVPEIKLR